MKRTITVSRSNVDDRHRRHLEPYPFDYEDDDGHVGAIRYLRTLGPVGAITAICAGDVCVPATDGGIDRLLQTHRLHCVDDTMMVRARSAPAASPMTPVTYVL